MITTRKFNLDPSSLLPGSAAAIELGANTSADVLAAVGLNQAFPEGAIDFANIGLSAEGGRDIHLGGGKGVVNVQASGGASLQLGIFSRGADIAGRLQLQDADEIGLAFPDVPGRRFAMFAAGYRVQGKLAGSHPVGVVGSATIGVEGQRAQRLAVVHEFAAADGARDVLERTFAAVKLPRHISDASKLGPGTHLITEVDGSIAVKIGAQLGYDFNFVRDTTLRGLQGDIGLKIETGLKVAIGLEVGGRFLLSLQRPGVDNAIRLRLFKLRRKGLDFGVNLAAMVQGEVGILPDEVDDLVSAVFGVHGQQVIEDLHRLEQWTDPTVDLSDKLAGLLKDQGLALLEDATGLDARAKFDEARAAVLAAVKKWDELPSTVSGFLWAQLERAGLSGEAGEAFNASLRLLAAADAGTRKKNIERLVGAAPIDNPLVDRFLILAADRGLAALLDDSEPVQRVAAITLDVLNGGIIGKLQRAIAARLNLRPILDAVSKADFDRIDSWLVGRLSAFFDRDLRFEDLDEIKASIHLVLQKRKEIYTKARQALEQQYDGDLSSKFQRTTARTALIDATFDTSTMNARRRLGEIVAESKLDALFTAPGDGVVLNRGVLTHELTRQSTVEVHLPSYNTKTTTLTKSLAQVTAQDEGGRVLFYELAASDELVKDRLKSQLALSAGLRVSPGSGLRVHDTPRADWAYRFVQVSPNLRRPDLERRLAPIALEYFPTHFTGGEGSLSAFLAELDRSVEDIVGNGPDEFGDVLLSLEVSLPGSAIASWFAPRNQAQVRAAARDASRRIQQSLQELIPLYFFRDLGNLQQKAAAPLLVFAALPALNAFRIDGGRSVAKAGAMWDVFDPKLREFVIGSDQTKGRLGASMQLHRDRLLSAGLNKQAAFFAPSELRDFIHGVGNDPHFVSLLSFTSRTVQGVEDALEDLAAFDADAATRPSKAIARLADFGADVVRTFNKDLSVYGRDLLRPLGSLVFMAAAPGRSAADTAPPRAVLALTVLKERRTYDMQDFLKGVLPPADQIAIQQRLVSA